MKRTEIDYVKEGEEYRVVAMRNIAGYDEIVEQYGREAAREYFNGAPAYYLHRDKKIFTINGACGFSFEGTADKCGASLIFPSCGDFCNFIKTLKTAGDRLIKIAKEHPKVKTIKI